MGYYYTTRINTRTKAFVIFVPILITETIKNYLKTTTLCQQSQQNTYIPQTITNVYIFQQKFEKLVSSVTSSTISRATHLSIKLTDLLISFMDRCVARGMVEPVTFDTKWCAAGCCSIILRESAVRTEVQGNNSDLPCFYVPCYFQSDSVNAEFWQLKLTGQTIINNVLGKWVFTLNIIWASRCVTFG
jgi:hypothetical protein